MSIARENHAAGYNSCSLFDESRLGSSAEFSTRSAVAFVAFVSGKSTNSARTISHGTRTYTVECARFQSDEHYRQSVFSLSLSIFLFVPPSPPPSRFPPFSLEHVLPEIPHRPDRGIEAVAVWSSLISLSLFLGMRGRFIKYQKESKQYIFNLLKSHI